MFEIVTFTDPVLEDVRYVVHLGVGKPRWFRVEGGTHTALTYVPDATTRGRAEPGGE
jgi:hypothetical protein